jgi:hypothetical protein
MSEQAGPDPDTEIALEGISSHFVMVRYRADSRARVRGPTTVDRNLVDAYG